MDGRSSRRQDARRATTTTSTSPASGGDAHLAAVSVEGEWLSRLARGTAGGEQEDATRRGLLSQTSAHRPDQAVDFVERPKVVHSRSRWDLARRLQVLAQAGRNILAMGIIEDIHRRLPNTHLVMHGSLVGLPQELQDIINSTAARCRKPGACRSRESNAESSRRPPSQHRHRQPDGDDGRDPPYLARQSREFDPRKYLKPAMDAMTKLCRARYEESRSAARPRKSSRFQSPPWRAATPARP